MNNDQKPAITLAQWCAYLPYDIDIFLDTEGCLRGKCKVNVDNLHLVSATPLYKLLLRPMNDPKIEWLVDEVYNSKVYHTLQIKYWSHNNQFKQGDDIVLIENLPNSLTQALRAAHYDLDNLIGQGLALPIE